MDTQIGGIRGVSKELSSEDMPSTATPFSLIDLSTLNETRQSPDLEEVVGNVLSVSTAQVDEVCIEHVDSLPLSVNAAVQIESEEERSDFIAPVQMDVDIDNPDELVPHVVMLTEPLREAVNTSFSERSIEQAVLQADAVTLQRTQKNGEQASSVSRVLENHNQLPVLQQALFGKTDAVQYPSLAGAMPEKQGEVELPTPSQAIPGESTTSQQHATETIPKVPELLMSGLNDFFANKLDLSQMGVASKLSGGPVASQENSIPDYRAALFELKSDVSMKANYQIDNFTAQIKMYPPNLGEINAKISVHNGQASISMVADDNQVKHMIEINLPRLRESFESSNLTLTDVDVRHDESSEKQKFSGQKERRDSTPSSGEQQRYGEHKQDRALMGSSIVDIYA